MDYHILREFADSWVLLCRKAQPWLRLQSVPDRLSQRLTLAFSRQFGTSVAAAAGCRNVGGSAGFATM